MRKKKYFLIYQIENLVNRFVYVGAHSTYNLFDNYMGSGTKIKSAINEFGIDNFEKTVLSIHLSKEEMLQAESQLVTREFINRSDTYNILIGGGNLYTAGYVSVKDFKTGKGSLVKIDDPKYLSRELVSHSCGTITVKNTDSKTMRVSVTDPRYISGELVPLTTGRVVVKDADGNRLMISKDDSKYLSGELKSIISGRVVVKDASGKNIMVSKDDPRYIAGELKPCICGTFVAKNKHGKNERISITDERFKNGEISHHSKNNIWIHNLELKKTKMIQKTEALPSGWVLGRKIKW